MSNLSQQIVSKAWNFAHVLRDDGLSYMGYTEQITFLLFLKMADELTRSPYNRPPIVPKKYGWDALLVRTLSRHWSLGLETVAGRSTRENYDLLLKVEPGIEYNLFPYEQSSRRQFVFIYSAGLNYANYRDSTIFNRLSETRPIHRFTIAGAATQPWGRLESRLVASTYLDDWSKNRLSLFGFAEVRIVRGLSLNVYGSYARIRDQLAIPKADIPDEEILLRLRELQTSYRWDFELGLSYTFGSKFSNIVNPRFNQSPGS